MRAVEKTLTTSSYKIFEGLTQRVEINLSSGSHVDIKLN
jgi:hypothetical protein